MLAGMVHSPSQVLSKPATACPQGGHACRYVYGRGALDVKVTVLALLEAVAHLLREGCALSTQI